MIRIRQVSFALVFVLALAGCERDVSTGPAVPDAATPVPSEFRVAPEAIADQLVRTAGWEIDAEVAASVDPTGLTRSADPLSDAQRIELGNGIVHYSFVVRFGPGEYDVIRLHRVVKERRPGQPGRILPHLFLLHGDAKDFTGMFLPGTVGPDTPDDWGLAYYLADRGIDVWGMDEGWCLIPFDETDQSVGVDWGLQRAADDLRLGVAVARTARLLTSSGYAPLNVLGYSSAVQTIWAAANDEAVLDPRDRQIGGLVQADFYPKTSVASFRETFCADLEFQLSLIDAGVYLSPIPFVPIVDLYLNDPSGDSPIFPGFSNEDLYWFFMTGQVFGAETFHYFAGIPGPSGLAEAFTFTPQDWVNDFLYAGIAFQPTQFFVDYDRVVCDLDDVPWDDNYSMIEVPILNLAARGGVNDLGLYATTLTSSTDVQSIVAGTGLELPLAFGHIDLFLAPLAEELAWEPLLDWVLEHAPQPRDGSRGRHVGTN